MGQQRASKVKLKINFVRFIGPDQNLFMNQSKILILTNYD